MAVPGVHSRALLCASVVFLFAGLLLSVGAGSAKSPLPSATLLETTAPLACATDEDCALNGVCQVKTGVCACDAGWMGPACGQLRLAPARRGTGYNLTGASPPTSSWGATIYQGISRAGPRTSAGTGVNSTWHMYAAEFTDHCDISHWSPNSRIVRATSEQGPLGPYHFAAEAVGAFAHNPKVVRAPDGTWLMYTIGTPLPASALFNCSGDGAALPRTPGRTPGNLESNVTLFTSEALEGPWQRFGQVLGPDDEASDLSF